MNECGSSERVTHNNSMSLKSLNRNNPAAMITGNELQISRFKPPSSAAANFKVPDDWFVEERPRPSKPSHIDKYYTEPGTGKKFRSLLAVQRYLTEEKYYVTPERMMSENVDTSGVKSGTGKRGAPGVRNCGKSALKRPSVAEEEGFIFTPKPLNFSVQSLPTNTSYQRKFNLGKDERGSIHSLSRSPAKVSWVLSNPGGIWSPFVDDTIVPESQKLKWSEAFVQSIHRGVSNR